MACCTDPKPETEGAASCGGGSCGCGSRPFPWFSAVCDPAIRRLFLLRYRRELLLGAGTGCLTGGAALLSGEGLGALGPLLGGPWLHFHAAATLPAAILAGLALALSMAWNGARGWAAASAWVLICLAAGGAGNGLLELGEGPAVAGFLREGGPHSVLAFALLGLPATWLVWGGLKAVLPPPPAKAKEKGAVG